MNTPNVGVLHVFKCAALGRAYIHVFYLFVGIGFFSARDLAVWGFGAVFVFLGVYHFTVGGSSWVVGRSLFRAVS